MKYSPSILLTLLLPLGAQFLTPSWRGNSNTEHAQWETYANPYVGQMQNLFNYPDVTSDSPTNDAYLFSSSPSAFITSSGNIYSFTEAPAFQLRDSANFTIRNVALQVITNGSDLDSSSVKLILPNASTAADILSPTETQVLNEVALGGQYGGTGTLWYFQWDLTSTPIASGQYRILFEALGAHMSLDKAVLDTAGTYHQIPVETVLPTPCITANGSSITLSWPADVPPGTELISTANLNDANSWSPVTQAPVLASNTYSVTLPKSAEKHFYRLKN